jgi:hypothetical protein
MSDTKFTPGPWIVDKSFNADIQAPDGLDIATCCAEILNRHTDGEEGIANAHLIAAAPDMYAALEKAVSDYGNNGGPWNVPSEPGTWIEMAQSALSKARGES